MPQQTRQRQLGGVRQTPWRGKENFSASSKTDTATLGCKGQNKRALPMLAMNTGFRCISKYLKVSQIKVKSLACTYSTLLRLFISTAVKAYFFFLTEMHFIQQKGFRESICQTGKLAKTLLPSNTAFAVAFLSLQK